MGKDTKKPKIFSSGLNSAFTLAEVLITLGIIGIIAALTIPSVIKNIRHDELRQQFKKSYSVLSQAVLKASVELGENDLYKYCTYSNGSSYVNQTQCNNTFYNQLKIQGTRAYTLLPVNYNNTAIANFSSIGEPRPPYLLADGSSVFCNVNGYKINITVDVNGPMKRPNRVGYDIFYFFVGSGNKLSLDKPSANYTQAELDAMAPNIAIIAGHPCNKTSTQGGNGSGCSYYAMIDKNPDDPAKGYWESLD